MHLRRFQFCLRRQDLRLRRRKLGSCLALLVRKLLFPLFQLRLVLGNLILAILQLLFIILYFLRTVGQFLLTVHKFLFTLFQFRPRLGQFLLTVIHFLLPVGKLLLGVFHLLIDIGKYLLVDRIDLLLPDYDIDALLKQTRRAGRCNTLYAFQFRNHQILRHLTDLRIRHLRIADRCDHNRQHVRIQFHNNRATDRIIPITLDLIQILSDLQRDGVHIRRLCKFQDHRRIVLAGNRTDSFDVADRSHGSLHRLCHHHLHGFRTGPGIRRHDDNIRQTDTRQQIR